MIEIVVTFEDLKEQDDLMVANELKTRATFDKMSARIFR